MPRTSNNRSRPRRLVLASPSDCSPPRQSGFDFTGQIRRVCEDMANRLVELQHINMSRMAIGFCQARKPVAHGLQAALTPMRFERGQRYTVRRDQTFTVQQIVDESGREFLYLLTFYLPRFLNLPFDEKLVTILHELWHISPCFDGDLRRHEGRCYVHTASEREYDVAMEKLAKKWLACRPPPAIYAFLRESFDSLRSKYGRVFGTRIPAPKLIPCVASEVSALTSDAPAD